MSTGDIHAIRLDGRTQLEVTGVKQVASFDVQAFELVTTAGALYIEGEGLHMKHFDVNAGIVRIEGKVFTLRYADHQRRNHLVGRLLR